MSVVEVADEMVTEDPADNASVEAVACNATALLLTSKSELDSCIRLVLVLVWTNSLPAVEPTPIRKVNDPPDVVPPPEEMVTSPPVEPPSPAVMLTPPPTPSALVVLPALMASPPPLLTLASPTLRVTAPPPVPDMMLIAPLLVDVAFAVLIVMSPLAAEVLKPVEISIEPLAPEPPAPLERVSFPPVVAPCPP